MLLLRAARWRYLLVELSERCIGWRHRAIARFDRPLTIVHLLARLEKSRKCISVVETVKIERSQTCTRPQSTALSMARMQRLESWTPPRTSRRFSPNSHSFDRDPQAHKVRNYRFISVRPAYRMWKPGHVTCICASCAFVIYHKSEAHANATLLDTEYICISPSS